MGLFQLQDMKFEDPFDVAQFFWHRYNIPNLAQWEWTWNCRVLQKLWKNQTPLAWLIINEEKLQSISSPGLGLFSAESSQCKAFIALGIWHFLLEAAGVIVPVVALGVHHEHLKWLLLQLQMAVPDPNKEGHGGFCLYSAVSGRNSPPIVQWSALGSADPGNFYKVKSATNSVWALSAFVIVVLRALLRVCIKLYVLTHWDVQLPCPM